MKNIFEFILALFLVTSLQKLYCQEDCYYIFYDDFNSNIINTELWHTNMGILGGDYSHEYVYVNGNCNYPQYNCAVGGIGCSSPDNIILLNSTCQLKANHQYIASCYSGGGSQEKWVKQASIVSKRKFKYGTFEARIKIDQGAGYWPAFWLFGQDGYNSKSEIDIFEINTFWNDRFTNNFHLWSNYNTNTNTWGSHLEDIENFDMNDGVPWWVTCMNVINLNSTIDEWHVYKMVWKPGLIQWYIDENLIRTKSINLPNSMHLILNMSAWAGQNPLPNTQFSYCDDYLQSSFPISQQDKSMYIDYVKVTPYYENSDILLCDISIFPFTLTSLNHSWGISRNYYYANNIYTYYTDQVTNEGSGCDFSFNLLNPDYHIDNFELIAKNSIVLGDGFHAHSEPFIQGVNSGPSSFIAKICDGYRAYDENPHDINDTYKNMFANFDSLRFNLYPNPTDMTLFIQIMNYESFDNGNIHIVDNLGRNIFSTVIYSSLTELDVGGLSPGIYFIQLQFKRGDYNLKFVKN